MAARAGQGNSPQQKPFLSIRLKDCEVQTFQSGGPGGQHQNHSNTGVRIIHRASGARGESREERSQLLNKKAAFRRMTEHVMFRVWVNRMIFYAGKSPEERVKEDLVPQNLRTEARRGNRWVPYAAEGNDHGGTAG